MSQSFDYKGIVLRNRTHRRDGWFVSCNGRTRWGTLEEVKADAQHILDYGRLPEQRYLWA